MNVTLETGEKVPTLRNCWRVVVDYMHGDADGDSTEQILFEDSGRPEDSATAAEYIGWLDLLLRSFNEGDSDDAAESFYEKMAEAGFSREDAERVTDNFTPGDCTCDFDRPATMTGYDVSYFDDDGIEYEVKVTIKP